MRFKQLTLKEQILELQRLKKNFDEAETALVEVLMDSKIQGIGRAYANEIQKLMLIFAHEELLK